MNELMDNFKKRFHEEYLLELRETSRDLYQMKWEDRVKVGDIVLIKHPAKTRPYWQMGEITDLIQGDDGKVRGVKLRTASNQVNTYAVSVLFPIELSITHSGKESLSSNYHQSKVQAAITKQVKTVASQNQSKLPPVIQVLPPQGVRPKRAAAVVSQKLTRKQLEQ